VLVVITVSLTELACTTRFAEPLSCELGTHKTVKARLWSWLEPLFRRKSRDHTLVGPLWEGGYHESRRRSRDTYLESYVTKYTSIRR